MSSYFNIYLSNVHLYANIGVGEQERNVGNEFILNLCVKVCADGFRYEDISTTISYADLYDIIKTEMGRKALLLESVAKRISVTINNRWQIIKEIRIRIDKVKPPIPGIDGSCGVEYCFSKTSVS